MKRLRSASIRPAALKAAKVFAYAAIAWTAGHGVMEAASVVADPSPLDSSALDSWKGFFDALKSSTSLKLAVELVALGYLGRDIRRSDSNERLRGKDIKVFGSPAVKTLGLAAVGTLIGAQIGAAAATVGPFYAPLANEGWDAFLASLPATPEARAAIYGEVQSPFSFHALAVYLVYRYSRDEIIREGVDVRGRVASLASALRERAPSADEMMRRIASRAPKVSPNRDDEIPPHAAPTRGLG